MKPIYFPYTYISDRVAQAVVACLGPFTVYQPLADKLPLSMQPWVDKGVIDIRIPAIGDDNQIVSAAKNYLDWASFNIGNARINPAALKTLKASAPSSDTSLSSQIAADVKKQMNRAAPDESMDPVLSARIFLFFAQEFDRQSQEIDHVLEEFREKEQNLIHDLKMEEDALADELKNEHGLMPAANTDYLISERLEAWTRILLEDRQLPEVFITHRPSVMEQLLDGTPSAEKIIDLEAIPQLAQPSVELTSWQEQMFEYLTDMVENKLSATSRGKAGAFDIPAAENTVSLKIYLVPNENAHDLFCRCTGIRKPRSDSARPVQFMDSTLLGLVELP